MAWSKFKILTGIAVLLVPLLVFFGKWNPYPDTDSSEPTNLQVAKIAQLFGLSHGSSLSVERFQLVYVNGLHDTMGSCGVRLKLDPADADQVLKSWAVSEDHDLTKSPALTKSNVHLIKWIGDMALLRKVPSFYTKTVHCVRTSERSGQWETWAADQHCVAFWDPETTNTLIVNTEGDMFLPDAVFR